MSNNNGDMPASPILNDVEGFTAFVDGTKGGRNYGLTKREHFAAMAMQAIIIGNNADICTIGAKGASLDAINCADALLKALDN